MDFTSNYFELFGLPVSYQVDLGLLAERYHGMLREFHPDRYVGKPSQEQRLAVQYAAVINQAYTDITSPLRRAQYLLSLQDMDASGDTHVTHDSLFLMQQIELRETLAEFREADSPFAALDSIAKDVESQYLELQQIFDKQYNQAEFLDAVETVAKMQFFSKLLNEVDQLEQELDD